VTDITLVMRRSATPQGPGLRLALTSPAVAGSVTLKATATIEPPGAAVAVWTVDGARIGTSVWTGSGREWRTEITASLAAGQRVVTVAYGVMSASDTLTVQDAGGVDTEIQLRIHGDAPTDWRPGLMSGDANSAGEESLTVPGAGLRYVMVGINYKTIKNAFYGTASWYVSSTASPSTAQFGALFVASAIIFRLQDCPAGTYTIYAQLNINGVIGPTNSVTLTVT
jgi:hypothetical protein